MSPTGLLHDEKREGYEDEAVLDCDDHPIAKRYGLDWDEWFARLKDAAKLKRFRLTGFHARSIHEADELERILQDGRWALCAN